jgi:hypothetical protein
MDQALAKILFDQPSITMGDAVLSAKSGIADQDTRKTFILFGDPLMRLKQPATALAPAVGPRKNLRVQLPGGNQ